MLKKSKLSPSKKTDSKTHFCKNCFKLYEVDINLFLKKFPDLKFDFNTKMKHLSGGEQRVIEIYLVLMKKSDLVILDEPFNHLSPIYVEKIERYFLKKKKIKPLLYQTIFTDQS